LRHTPSGLIPKCAAGRIFLLDDEVGALGLVQQEEVGVDFGLVRAQIFR
jgi:hypothetical protein